MKREYGISPRASNPQVVLRETVRKEAEAAAVFDKELGKERHQGSAALRVAPRARGTGNTVEVGDFLPQDAAEARKILPRVYLDAALEGVRDALQSGDLTGYPVEDVAVTLTAVDRQEGVTTIPGCRMFLVEINNRLQELKREEREEERKVLVYLRTLLEAELPGARAALELLAQLDVLQAKRRLAALYDGRCLPLTPVAEGIQLIEARHPLLLLNRTAECARDNGKDAKAAASAAAHSKVRPLDIVLRPGERALVITGGNAGGKTVCLKTLGLIAAMYLREMGAVPLLDRDGEVVIAKKIEMGEQDVLYALVEVPVAVEELINVGEDLRQNRVKLKDVVKTIEEDDPSEDEMNQRTRVILLLDEIKQTFKKKRKIYKKLDACACMRP